MDSTKKRKLNDISDKEDSSKEKQKLEQEKRLKKVKLILEKKSRINSVIYSLDRNMNVLRQEIKDLDNELYSVCPHEWVRDWDSYEPCGPTPKICKHCQL